MQLFTFEDVWSIYKISRSTLLLWEKKGILKEVITLPGSKHRRFKKEDIEQALGIGA